MTLWETAWSRPGPSLSLTQSDIRSSKIGVQELTTVTRRVLALPREIIEKSADCESWLRYIMFEILLFWSSVGCLRQGRAWAGPMHFLLNIVPGGRASGRLSSTTAKSQTWFISNMVYRLLTAHHAGEQSEGLPTRHEQESKTLWNL